MTLRRVAPGIYQTPTGYRARVSVGPRRAAQTREKRFPLDTELRAMKAWQTLARADLLATQPAAARSGTLAAEVDAYLATLTGGTRADAARLLAHWTARFGDRPALSLTRRELAQQLDAWRQTRAAATCNHRLSRLHSCYRARFPDQDTWPTSGVRGYREPAGEVREIPAATWRALLKAMAPSRAKACLEVFAETGIPPARLRRLRPEHLDLAGRTVYLEARRKGAGTLGRRFPLTAAAVRAFKAFVVADAWGGVTAVTMHLVFQRAVRRVNTARTAKGLSPVPPLRMYDLRHTFGARAYRLTGDVRAVAELLDVTVETALRYTRAAVPETMSKVIAALDAAAPAPRRGGRRGSEGKVAVFPVDHGLPKPARRVRFP